VSFKTHRLATSGISDADERSVTVRGKQLTELIGTISFTEFFVLLLMGRLPSADERFFLDATLVAIAEHGFTPTVQAARMTIAADPASLQGAVAAGILGCGTVVLGTAEEAGKMLHAALERARASGRDEATVAREMCEELRARRAALPGFGHPFHRPEDPRAQRLLALADARGTAGPCVRMIRAFAATADDVWGKHLLLNVSGAIAAVMLDVGFPLDALKGIPILARTAGILAHLHEDATDRLGFFLASKAAEAVNYVEAQQ
jgi:citrate synthase